MKVNRILLNNTKFISLTFLFRKKRCMLASGWSLQKGDWWYKDDPKNSKFFSADREIVDNKISYGIYLGRLGLRFMREVT